VEEAPTDERIDNKKMGDGSYLLDGASHGLSPDWNGNGADGPSVAKNEPTARPAWDTHEKPVLPEDSYWAEFA
jgi:hypothetical protein